MSTPLAPIQPPNSDPLSPELKSMLDFISRENERHRQFFNGLFEKCVWILGILLALAGAAATFIGFNTAAGVKNAADQAINARLTQLQPSFDKKIDDGVRSAIAEPKIDVVIQTAAKEATVTTANKLIRQEVQSQVSTAVASQQAGIDRTLDAAVDRAVDGVQSDIQHKADNAVSRLVAERVDPQITVLKSVVEETAQYNMAKTGDAISFDRLVSISQDTSEPKESRDLASVGIESIRKDYGHQDLMGFGCGVEDLNVLALDKRLKSDDTSVKDRALKALEGCVFLLRGTKDGTVDGIKADITRVYPLLEEVFLLMTTDPQLQVRQNAFFAFRSIVRLKNEDPDPGLVIFDNSKNTLWWSRHRRDYLK